jgi:hypothetical protein
MKNVIFLQGWYSNIADNWYEWLKKELDKKGYTTHFIDLPEMRKDVPDMNTIITKIESLGFIDRDTTLIGHSLGCLLAMRLAERYTVSKMILASGWDFDDLTEGHKTFWPNKIDHARIKSHVKKIYVIHSDNDPYITKITAEDMGKRLGAEFILVPNGGHLNAKSGITKLPQLLNIL